MHARADADYTCAGAIGFLTLRSNPLQRVLPSAEIAASAPQPIPRLRLPQRSQIFAQRAQRLRQLAADHAIGDYLRLMATLADAQHAALADFSAPAPSREDIERAHAHRMPVVAAAGSRPDPRWQNILVHLCDTVTAPAQVPDSVTALCARLRSMPAAELEAQADALLAGRSDLIDVAAAPFIMAALQVCRVGLASMLAAGDVAALDVPGVCPVCGSLPVASVVRIGKPYAGYRYLHCALCATEWHMVRIKCSHCDAIKDIAYHLIEGGAEAVRAESCGQCHTYRKILYQEKDAQVEPVADDLASLALDLLMSQAGYHRASANPLLWQRANADG